MIALDGVIFTLQRNGGISVYFNELIKHLDENHIQTKLLLDSTLRMKFDDSCASRENIFNEYRRLERYRACNVPKPVTGFHSSYYRLPSNSDLPAVVTVHDFIYEKYVKGPRSWLHSYQKNKAIRAATSIICVSETTREDLLKALNISDKNIYTIFNGVSDVFRPESSPNLGTPFILFVGQRKGYKNFKFLADALKFLPDIEVRCVGGGPLTESDFFGVTPSERRRIVHEGFVTEENLNRLYNQAVCLVYPSLYEGFGIPVIEAMKAGCPVICTPCKAVIEIGGDALTVVADQDIKSLAEEINRLFTRKRIQMIQRGIVNARRFSWRETHENTLNVYRRSNML